jgi:hypothetical protein
LAHFGEIGGEADAQGAKCSISALADWCSRFIKLTAQRITLTLEGALPQNVWYTDPGRGGERRTFGYFVGGLFAGDASSDPCVGCGDLKRP